MNGQFTEEQIQMTRKHINRCSFSQQSEMQIQVQCCHLYLSNWRELKRVIMPTADSE